MGLIPYDIRLLLADLFKVDDRIQQPIWPVPDGLLRNDNKNDALNILFRHMDDNTKKESY